MPWKYFLCPLEFENSSLGDFVKFSCCVQMHVVVDIWSSQED